MQDMILGFDTYSTHPVLSLAVDGMLGGGTGVEKLMPCAANAVRRAEREKNVRFGKRILCYPLLNSSSL